MGSFGFVFPNRESYYLIDSYDVIIILRAKYWVRFVFFVFFDGGLGWAGFVYLAIVVPSGVAIV